MVLDLGLGNERVHLSTHPAENVKPGGSDFSTCNAEHHLWHSDINIDH